MLNLFVIITNRNADSFLSIIQELHGGMSCYFGFAYLNFIQIDSVKNFIGYNLFLKYMYFGINIKTFY